MQWVLGSIMLMRATLVLKDMSLTVGNCKGRMFMSPPKGKWIRPQDYITSDMLFYTTNRALADIGKGLRINFSKHVA